MKKLWWFWGMVLFILGVVGCGDSDSVDLTDDPPQFSEVASIDQPDLPDCDSLSSLASAKQWQIIPDPSHDELYILYVDDQPMCIDTLIRMTHQLDRMRARSLTDTGKSEQYSSVPKVRMPIPTDMPMPLPIPANRASSPSSDQPPPTPPTKK